MPRMSKKRRLEWSFFLNHRNRITYNDLCRGCTRDCKQSFRAVIILISIPPPSVGGTNSNESVPTLYTVL